MGHGRDGGPRGVLWDRDFLRFWAGETVSALGSQVTVVAGPLTAALTLAVTPAEMGALRAAAIVPGLVAGLLAGAWADRVRRRPLIVAADVVSALALGSVPIAAVLGTLTLGQLIAVLAVAAVCAAAHEPAAQAYLPGLVGRPRLLAANSVLRGSVEAARTTGPALGGVLVQLLTAPIAIAADAASFALAAVAFAGIRAREPHPAGERQAEPLLAAIGHGLVHVARDPVLRVAAGTAGIFNFFDAVVFAVYVLYATRVLHLGGAALGVVFTAGGIGGLAGAFLAARAARRLGTGSAMIVAVVVAALGELAIPFARGTPIVAAAILMLAELLVGAGVAVWGINNSTIRQARTPARTQARVHASVAVISGAMEAVGALAGGLLGQVAGMRAALIVGAAGTLLAAVWVVASPLRSVREP